MADKENSSATDDASRDLYERGREAMSKGYLPLAISHFNESIRLSPHFKTLELLGECYLKQRQYQQALVPLGASVGLGSRPFRSLWLLARALEAVGERQDAIEKLIDALAMQPTYRTAAAG